MSEESQESQVIIVKDESTNTCTPTWKIVLLTIFLTIVFIIVLFIIAYYVIINNYGNIATYLAPEITKPLVRSLSKLGN